MTKGLSILTVLVGLVLAATPWLLRFTTDRVAALDAVVGGLVVAVLGTLTVLDLRAGNAREHERR